MKILILENIFNFNIFQSKFKRNYKILKLRSITRKIRKQYDDVKIEIISGNFEKYFIDKKTDVKLLLEYRLKLDRTKFLKIKTKIYQNTKKNLIRLFSYYFKSKTFHLNGVLIPKIIDFSYMKYFNTIFGEFELLKCIFEERNFDRIILFRCNLNFFKFFQRLNKDIGCKIDIYRDPILDKKRKLLTWFFSNYFISLLGVSIINSFSNPNYKKSYHYIKNELKERKKNIVFATAHTENQYRSLKPIYDKIKKSKKFYTSFYRDNDFIPILKLNQLIKFLFKINKLLNESRKKFVIEYDSVKLRKFLLTYENSDIFFKYLVVIFNNSSHFIQFTNLFEPSLVIFADEERILGKLWASICNRQGILSLYIPHAAIPINPLEITKKEFDYTFVPGEKDKEYFVRKGVIENNIFVTGRPRYNEIYKRTIKKLTEVKDMFSNRIYKFSQHKFTILFTTSPIDFKSKKILFYSVLRSLKELKLIGDLIIKLHPRERGLFYKNILKEMNVNPVVVRDIDILSLINSSDLLLSRISTTILEAIILRTPIIVLDYVNTDLRFTDTLLFLREKSLITVKNQYELTEKIKNFVDSETFLAEYIENLGLLAKKYSPKTKVNPIEKSINLINKILE